MKNITNRGRKILGKIFRVISVSVVSLILQACYGVMFPDEPYAEYGMPAPAYGMPPDEPYYVQQTVIRGTVVAEKTGDPIFGIKVSIEGTSYSARTDLEGYFYISGVPVQDVYNVKFEDVDGIYNDGLFKE